MEQDPKQKNYPEKQFAAIKKEETEAGVQFYINRGRLKLLRNTPLGQKFFFIPTVNQPEKLDQFGGE